MSISLRAATRSRTRITGAAVVVAAAGLLLGLDLAKQPADPPRDLSASIGVLDEGIWSHNAVNDALFGEARLDDFNPEVVTSGSWLYRAAYAIFGVGLTETKLPSIALGVLAVLLVGFLAGREDPVAGAVAAVLLASCSLFLAYSRLGLLETPAAASAAAGLAFLVFALSRARRWAGALGGALLAAAITVKPQVAASVLGVGAGVTLWFLLDNRRADRTPGVARTLGAALAGFVLVGVAWAGYIAANLDDAARSEWRWHTSGVLPHVSEIPTNIANYLRDSDGFGTRARPLIIAAAIGAALQATAWARGRRRPGPLDLAAIGWATAGVTAVASLPYTPSRYAVLPLPGLALVAGGGAAALRSLIPPGAGRRFAAAGLAGAAALAAIPGLHAWISWASHAEFNVRGTGRLLARETAPDEVILSGWALLPSVHARRRVVVVHVPDINDRCTIERFGVDWVMLNAGDRGERAFFEERYPGLLTTSNRVATTTVMGRRLWLYRLPAGTVGVGCG